MALIDFVLLPCTYLAANSNRYGQLLLAKLVLFGAMLVLASLNRFRLTPALEQAMPGGDQRGALSALRLSLGIEVVCAIVILALVAWLGTLEPPMSAM